MNSYHRHLKIGLIEVKPGLTLAPMAGITSSPYRLLAVEQGCQLVFSEMISAKGLLHNNAHSKKLLYYTNAERPLGVQLFGSDPDVLARAAEKVENEDVDFIDINMGCPTRKIVSNNEGGALLRNPVHCEKIFRAVIGAVSCPVTVKTRKGWDEKSESVLEIARRAEQSGIAAITVHGRTVKQGYSGTADWDIVKRVKKTVSIPVIGNGDVDSPQKVKEMFYDCNCDGVMIGRAARGNPWIFRDVLAFLEQGKIPERPSIKEIVEMVMKHFSLLVDLKGEKVAAHEMRQHSAWYIKGLPGAAAARQRLVHASSQREFESILYELCGSLM